jgi:hypothetical protein
MASTWRSSITLVDTKGIKSTVNYRQDLDEATLAEDFAIAAAQHVDLVTQLMLVTDANRYSESLTVGMGGSPTLPADADVTDMGMVQTYLNDAGELGKYHTLRIPAPVDGIFEVDLITIDKLDAALIAFVAEVGGYFVVSDGEVINLAIEDGIAGGSWASVKKSTV